MDINNFAEAIEKVNSRIISHNLHIELEISKENQLILHIVGNDRFGFTHYITSIVTDEFLSRVDYSSNSALDVEFVVRPLAFEAFQDYMQHILFAANFEEFTPIREKILGRADGLIAVDLDGTICTVNKDYSKCELLPDALEVLNWLKDKGATLAIHTARQLEDYKVTVKWLKDNKVPYDFLAMAKLKAGLYVDDRSFNPLKGISAMKKIYGDLK